MTYLYDLIESISGHNNEKFLYHASSIQNLKFLKKEYNTSNIETNSEKKWIYAGPKKMIAAFSFPWVDSMGITYTGSGKDLETRIYTITIPRRFVNLISKPCSIYTIDKKSFVLTKGGLRDEYRSSRESIKILFEEKYKSAKECMEKNNIIIKIK